MAVQSSALSSARQDVYKIFYWVFMYSEFEISVMEKQKKMYRNYKLLFDSFLNSLVMLTFRCLFLLSKQLKKKELRIMEDGF